MNKNKQELEEMLRNEEKENSKLKSRGSGK
jgi:hypothetical protein